MRFLSLISVILYFVKMFFVIKVMRVYMFKSSYDSLG